MKTRDSRIRELEKAAEASTKEKEELQAQVVKLEGDRDVLMKELEDSNEQKESLEKELEDAYRKAEMVGFFVVCCLTLSG